MKQKVKENYCVILFSEEIIMVEEQACSSLTSGMDTVLEEEHTLFRAILHIRIRFHTELC